MNDIFTEKPKTEALPLGIKGLDTMSGTALL